MTNRWIRKQGRWAFLTLLNGQDEREVRVPFCLAICPACRGSGTDHGRSVECDDCYGEPSGFTATEWAEQDDDFKQDYLNGVYDKPCTECRDLPGRVVVPDLDALSDEDRKLWQEQLDNDAEYEQLCRMERRMGA